MVSRGATVVIWPWSRFATLIRQVGQLRAANTSVNDALDQCRTEFEKLGFEHEGALTRITKLEESRSQWKQRYLKTNEDLSALKPSLTALQHDLAMATQALLFKDSQIRSLEETLTLVRKDTETAHAVAKQSKSMMQYLFNDDPFREIKELPDEFESPEDGEVVDGEAVAKKMDEASAQQGEMTTTGA